MKLPSDKWLFHQEALQEYLLCCCQDTSGGLLDKPDKRRDFYHTCYALSGLSVTQNVFQRSGQSTFSGREANRVTAIHPIFNIHLKATE
jgi:protein farnesyltransferase subunit beta